MSFENDNESDRRRKNNPTPPAANPTPPHASPTTPTSTEDMPKNRKKRGSDTEIGQALRQAYSDAVGETVPPEMLDLLGRLG